MTALPYKYEFEPSDLQGIRTCNEQHGFAIVKGLISPETVERLKDEVRSKLGPQFTDESVPSVTDAAFVEKSPTLTQLMTYEPLMKIVRFINNDQPIALNRSAAIYKKPGAAAGVKNSGSMAWHTDWEPKLHPYRANGVLNTTGACSYWFYLTGSQPINGGLSIIPDSHTEDWTAPEGFEFTARRKSFHRTGTESVPYIGMDVPGMIPVVTEPGDLVVFAERTYHGVNPHRGTEPRLSCALSFRVKDRELGPCWPLTESAKKFIDSCPDEIYDLVDVYVGIDFKWLSQSV
jgi:hypothetical protein